MSGFEISPATITATHNIQRYGDGQFRIADTQYKGSVIVFPGHAQSWDMLTGQTIHCNDLPPVIERSDEIDILVLGCGGSFSPPPKELRAALKEYNIGAGIHPLEYDVVFL